ncbi:MAG: hypothetical protein AB8F95_22455 [Bacteroidia bacterium]
MDRTADIFLQRAFKELKAFTIPEVGTFYRPSTLESQQWILWNGDTPRSEAISLIDFLTKHCNKGASEAEAIQAKIRVALRHSLKIRGQYYIPGAGTIRQEKGELLAFLPELAMSQNWFPEQDIPHQIHDTDPTPSGSTRNKILIGLFVVAALAITLSGFFGPSSTDDQTSLITETSPQGIETPAQEQEIESPTENKELNDAAQDAPEPINKKLPIVKNTAPTVSDNTGKSGSGDGMVKSPSELPSKPNPTPVQKPSNPGISSQVNPSNAGSGNQGVSRSINVIHHIIAASKLEESKARALCETLPERDQCQLILMDDGSGLYRVSVYQTYNNETAVSKRSAYHKDGKKSYWIFHQKVD